MRTATISRLTLALCLILFAAMVTGPARAGPPPSEAAYQKARRAFYRFKDDKEKQKFRHNWKNVAGKFEAVAEKYPDSSRAPDALFTAGKLYHDLYKISRVSADLDHSIELFSKLVERFGQNHLADDAQYWVAHTYEMQGRLIGGPDPDAKLLEVLTDEGRRTLRADLDLRRRFNPDATPPPPPAVPAGLGSAEREERARELLGSAVKAYARVAGEHKLSDRAPEALVRIGKINARFLKDADAATEAYRQLLEKYPGTRLAVAEQCAVGQAYVRRGELKEAERLLKVFMASFPNHERYGDALLFMAECHRRQKEYVKALDDYQTFLSRRPGSPRAGEVREEIAWLKKYRL